MSGIYPADAQGATTEPQLPEPRGWPQGLFRESPFGLLVTDRDGLLLSTNPRALELLFNGSTPGGLSSATCCELICARLNPRADGAGNAACLIRGAVRAGGALPEARLAVNGGGVRRSVWVTASPIGLGEEQVVVYLRPEDPVELDGHPPAGVHEVPVEGPELRIYTFGRTRVEAEGRALGGEWLHQRPGQLLQYLLCERHHLVASDQISEALWPEASPWTTNSVRHQVHALRDRLEPGRASGALSRFVVTRRGGYALDRERIWIDADEFEDQVRAGLTLFVQGEGGAAATRLERALSLYKGDFFSDDPYAEWALEERDRLRELAGQALRAVVSLKRSAGDLDGAAEPARRLAAMEPYDMDVQRDVLEICMRRGRRSEAIRRYALIRRRVRQEFGHDPDFTLADLGG